ncbi:hypothetical protein CN918_31965 [Priestia megaterium]|nr:hypothetical protein CN918_31965 [Priestia megaterium]
MYCELSLPTPHRKSQLQIVGGGENIIFTTVPTIHNQHILLNKEKEYALNVFDTHNLFHFQTQYTNVLEEGYKTYLSFTILKTSIDQNKRKEIRELTDIPVLIEANENYLQIGRVLDLSKTGAKIECIQPLTCEDIIVHFQGAREIKKVAATILWGSSTKDHYYYGIKF